MYSRRNSAPKLKCGGHEVSRQSRARVTDGTGPTFASRDI